MKTMKPCKNHKLAGPTDSPEFAEMAKQGVLFAVCFKCGWLYKVYDKISP